MVTLVSKLRTHTDEDREKLDKLMKELTDAYARGEVHEILFAYIDGQGASNYAVSGNMKVSNFAYLVAVLKWRLHQWIDKS